MSKARNPSGTNFPECFQQYATGSYPNSIPENYFNVPHNNPHNAPPHPSLYHPSYPHNNELETGITKSSGGLSHHGHNAASHPLTRRAVFARQGFAGVYAVFSLLFFFFGVDVVLDSLSFNNSLFGIKPEDIDRSRTLEYILCSNNHPTKSNKLGLTLFTVTTVLSCYILRSVTLLTWQFLPYMLFRKTLSKMGREDKEVVVEGIEEQMKDGKWRGRMKVWFGVWSWVAVSCGVIVISEVLKSGCEEFGRVRGLEGNMGQQGQQNMQQQQQQ